MMKLVMVDPSKSGKDKVRSNTFHHFKKTSMNTAKNNEKSLTESSKITNGNKPIVFHRFADDSNSSIITVQQKVDRDNKNKKENKNIGMKKTKNLIHGHTDTINISSRIKTQKRMMNRLDFMKNNTNEHDLVIRVDPRYNVKIDKISSKHHVLKSQNSEFVHSEPIWNVSPNNGSMANSNKIKKITFVNNTNKLSNKNLGVINTSDQDLHHTAPYPIITEATREHSKPLGTNDKFENLTMRKDREPIVMNLGDDNVHNNSNDINKNERMPEQTALTSENRNAINTPPVKHPLTKDYLTHKFRVSMSDGKPKNG